MKSLSGKSASVLERYRSLVPYWNDSKYEKPALERKIGKKFPAIAKEVEEIREKLETDPDLMAMEPEPFVSRDPVTGHIVLTHENEREWLRKWEIDRNVPKTAKGVIVTSAQFNGELQMPVFQALKRYAEYRGFPLVVLPIKYGPVHVDAEGRIIGTFPEELKGMMSFEKFRPIPSLMFNPLRMRPTLDRFLTDAICAVGAETSQIFAAPVFELEHRPRVGKRAGDRYPKAIMTSGAVTKPNYRRDNLGQQDRTGELATARHSYGGVVFEFSSDRKIFHFRQLVVGKSGRFYDIGPSGVVSVTPQDVRRVGKPGTVAAMVLGDWHAGFTDASVKRATFSGKESLVRALCPEHIVLQDFIDGFSVNPFDRILERGHMPLRVLKKRKGWDCLLTEFMQGVKDLSWMAKHAHGSTVFHYLPSNHPEFVEKFILDGAWLRDPANAEVGAELYLAWIKDIRKSRDKKGIRDFDPVGHHLRAMLPETLSGRVHFHQRKMAVKFPPGVSPKKRILVLHGDIGMHGRPSRGFKEFRKQNIRIFLGHNHSAMIWDGIWRVGVSTPLSSHYIQGPSTAWTNTHGVIFENGQRMLVNIVNGKWHGDE